MALQPNPCFLLSPNPPPTGGGRQGHKRYEHPVRPQARRPGRSSKVREKHGGRRQPMCDPEGCSTVWGAVGGGDPTPPPKGGSPPLWDRVPTRISPRGEKTTPVGAEKQGSDGAWWLDRQVRGGRELCREGGCRVVHRASGAMAARPAVQAEVQTETGFDTCGSAEDGQGKAGAQMQRTRVRNGERGDNRQRR